MKVQNISCAHTTQKSSGLPNSKTSQNVTAHTDEDRGCFKKSAVSPKNDPLVNVANTADPSDGATCMVPRSKKNMDCPKSPAAHTTSPGENVNGLRHNANALTISLVQKSKNGHWTNNLVRV